MCLEAMEVSREEAKRILRRLELEAYSSIVSTFRAQGDLNREKKKLLTDLGVHLSISTERHRAEVRRAFSDDRLGAVADCIVGPSTCSEWAAEGRRLVPLMPRLVPQTILSGTATASANAAAATNAQISAQVKKTAAATTQPSTGTRETAKSSSVKPFARQNSETVDVEYDSDDNKAKKKRKLGQSVAAAKSPKMLLNPVSLVNKQGTKTASVSTSTMTKVGKQPSTVGNLKATQKQVLPASASQVKLLTKTVSITQTVCQAKTMLSYKNVGATNPAAVKVQTVMSHTTPKPQVKVAVPSLSKNVLVPKSSVSTSPSKPVVIGTSPLKSGITISQLAAKQRGKQTARFKPVASAVKYKPVTPTVDSTSSSSNITTLTGSAIPGTSNTQPIVRVIQVPSTGGVGISKPMIVMTTGPSKPTVSVSSGASILKFPISATTQTSTVSSTIQASRMSSQPPAPPKPIIASSPKTVVVSAIVGGTKKVVLSVPAPVTPIQAKSSAASSTAKVTGLSSQLSQPFGDANKQKVDKPPGKKATLSSLECTEPSSFLKAPPVALHKTGAVSTLSSQVRPRPLQTLLPAPPKPVTVPPTTPLSSAPTGRKLPQILPAPAKTSVLVPLPTPTTQTVCSTSVVSTALVSTAGVKSKVPMVQLMGKPIQTSVSKSSMAKPFPDSSAAVSLPVNMLKQSLQQSGLRLQTTNEVPGSMVEIQPVPNDAPLATSQSNTSLSDLTEKERSSDTQDNCTIDDKQDDQDALQIEQRKPDGMDNNTSSEDDSLLVCSETIDSSTGLHDAPLTPEGIPMIDRAIDLTSSPVEPEEILSLRPMSDGADNLENLPTEPLTAEQALNITTEKGLKLPGKSTFMEDFFKESDSMLHNVEGKIQITTCKKIPTVLEKRDEKPKELDQENNVKLPGELEGFKTFAMDGVKDFDAVSSFLQSFVGEQNLSESSKSTSSSSSYLDCKELHEENQDWKPEPQSKIPAESKQHKEETEAALKVMPQIGCLSKSLDINAIPLTTTNNEPEENSQCEVIKDVFGVENIQQQSYKDDNLKLLQDCSKASEGSLPAQDSVMFSQSVTEQVSGQCSSSEQGLRDFPDISVGSGIIDGMLVGSPSSAGHDQDLTESERLALEAIANVRTSGRKRKPPSILTLSPPRQTSGWVRGAQSLLQKVCSFRGQGRKKGDYSAVSWFLRPVDPNEAPGYFKVIKTPMDFSTIKSKLEAGLYNDYIEFHEDMMLIKTNCLKYNPPGHGIRKDCEEVFLYFETEYEKMLERWEKCHVSPAKKPRTMSKSELAPSMSC